MKTIRVTLSPEAEEVYHHLTEEAAHSKIERSILNTNISNHKEYDKKFGY